MASTKIDQLEKLKAQQTQLEAKIKKIEAQQKAQTKKDDTRRKILIGSYFLNQYEAKNEQSKLVELMDGFLTRKRDRALFDLPEKKEVL